MKIRGWSLAGSFVAVALLSGCGDLNHGDLGSATDEEVNTSGNQQDAVKGRSKCLADPNPALVGDTFVLSISGMPRNTQLTITTSDDAGQQSEQGTTNQDGRLSLIRTAAVMGSAQVDISVPSKRGERQLTSCRYAVIEGGVCGNAICEVGEDCVSCESDCGACPAACGDGACNGSEDCSSCEEDCGACPAACGDGACNGSEDCSSCEEDCGACPAACGDGACNGSEDCSTCEEDCGACQPACGDGACNGNEDCSSCEEDCGACQPACGDGACNGNEDCSSCELDCGACEPICGDGACNGDEDCSSCELDCGTCMACTPAVNTSNSGKHKAGAACRSCHDGSKPNFVVAGTLFDGPNSTTPVVGATIHLIDATGREIELVTAENGNFYSRDTSIAFPLTTFASRCPDTQVMSDPVQRADGDCNSCHDAGNRIHLP